MNLYNSAVQIVEINLHNVIANMVSGCLVSIHGKRILLTVAQATRDFENWAIQLEFDDLYGTSVFSLEPPSVLTGFDELVINGHNIQLSFSVIPSDLEVLREYLHNNGDLIRRDVIKTYEIDSLAVPSKDESYGFLGAVLAELNPNQQNLIRPSLYTEVRCYYGLTFVREENDGLVFNLPSDHPGHKYLQGCCGAPIVSTEEKLLGLVIGANPAGEILAISLRKVCVLLEAFILSQPME